MARHPTHTASRLIPPTPPVPPAPPASRHARRRLACALTALAIWPCASLAQSISYSASTGCGVVDLSATPVDLDTCASRGGCVGCGGQCPYALSDAQSDNTRLHATSQQIRYGGWSSCGGGWMSDASASWRLSVIFTGPQGASSVTPTLVLPFRATIDVTQNPQANDGASFRVTAFISEGTSFPFGGFSMGDSNSGLAWSIGGPNTPVPTSINFAITGANTIEATGVQHGVRQTGASVPLDTNVFVYAGVSVHMHNGDFSDGSQVTDAHIRAEFGAAPVFILPPGYSAYSTDGRIVDNHWVAPRPFITQPPVNRLICPGGNSSFSVTATSQTPMTYQWRRNSTPLTDTPPFSATTSSTLVITGATPAEQGTYDCVVTNINGDTITSSATLTICRADTDCSGAISVQDIFTFLVAWFAADPAANFNDVDGVTVQDIFDFLAAWFQGC